MRVAGLTGGIACGKSTVSRLLHQEHGLPVIDCDLIAHQVTKKVQKKKKKRDGAGRGVGTSLCDGVHAGGALVHQVGAAVGTLGPVALSYFT